MHKSNLPVGVFDSGLGGLTAVREIKKIMPGESIVYFGDTGRLPYGTRSPEIIKKYACDDMNFLLTNSVKSVLIACGTVSSTALEVIKRNFNVPVIGVVDPASKKACEVSKTGKIAVLATPSTIRTGSFDKAIKAINPDACIMGVGCPMFVPLVENGYISRDCEITKKIAAEYISKLFSFSPDTIILGCTHYPLIKDVVRDCAREVLGKEVSVIDSGSCAAEALKSFLAAENLSNNSDTEGVCKYFVSDQPYNFSEIASRFLGERVSDVKQISIDDYLYQSGH